jgi:hypothetical protein
MTTFEVVFFKTYPNWFDCLFAVVIDGDVYGDLLPVGPHFSVQAGLQHNLTCTKNLNRGVEGVSSLIVLFPRGGSLSQKTETPNPAQLS